MPAKNSLKIYISDGFYHIYNRGIEKREIFLNNEDYRYFLFLLKIYLSPKELTLKELERKISVLEKLEGMKRNFLLLNNFYQKIELLSYCLIPNHFHLLIRQKEKKALEFFMRSLLTKYVLYFNKKYDRKGHLFEGRYKAVLVHTEEQLIHLSRYIHLNPIKIVKETKNLLNYLWSSYPIYIQNWDVGWINKEHIINHFKKDRANFNNNFNNYQKFVEDYKETEENKKIYTNLILDSD